MLAEKFLLLLETLRSHANDDGSTRIVSTSPHVAIDLTQAGSGRSRRMEASADPRRAGR